jgi:predicted ribosome quality control (RQC) complex YloA/Tae2 family protein
MGKALKGQMSSFDIAAITSEINRIVKGARIDNIYQISPTTLLLSLHQSGQTPIYLIAESGKRIHVTSYTLKGPQKPTAFCMALRKYLKNGRIIEAQQHEFERTVIIIVETKEGEFQIVVELFGDGNIILVSPQNTVLHALVYRKMRDRNVWRGEIFRHAPQKGRNPLKLSREDLVELRNFGEMEIVRALTKFLSIGGLYAEETLLRAEIDKNKPCNSLTEEEFYRIFDQLHQILSFIINGKTEPIMVFDEKEELVDVTPVPLKTYSSFKLKSCESFNEALDEYYTKTVAEERGAEFAKLVEKQIAKQERILERQQKAIESLKQRIEQNKRIGNAIYMHFNELQFLLQKIMNEKRSGKPWNQIVSSLIKERETGLSPAAYFNSLEPERLVLNVSLEKLIFPLSLRHSIQENAAGYYARAKKAEEKLEGVEKALHKTENNIKSLKEQSVERLKTLPKLPPKRRKRMWYEKFLWFHSSDSLLVIGGRDAATNEILIKKHMEPNDKVFHADIHGAPFVVVKTDGKAPPEETMKEAAQLAASYSRAWKEMLGSADVYWVSPQQISKSPPQGQYLEKGAFIISGQKNYVRNVPLRVAVGIKMEEEKLMVIGGPTEAIAKQTNIYVEVVPGEKQSGELAKQIRWRLAEGAPKAMQRQAPEIALEEIQRFIPSGRGNIK